MAGIVDTFQAFSGILVICPCCGELLRVAELSLRYTGKFERTVLDDLRQHEKRLEKKQETLDRQLDRFEAKEDALRRAAAERGRKRMKRLIRRNDPSMSKLQYDPQDIKVIAHPVDLVVFDGLNSGGNRIKNVIFIARSKVKTYKGMRRSVARALEKGSSFGKRSRSALKERLKCLRDKAGMPKLFSYVVHHDHGFSPNPSGGYCSLAWCKYKTKRRNVVELAEEGDWVVGTGGADLRKSAGHGKLIYAMRVDEKLPLAEYCGDRRFADRIDTIPGRKGRFAVISQHFFYFGRNAVPIPSRFLDYPLEKKGPAHRRDFDDDFISGFVAWLEDNFKVGVHGPPCQPHPEWEMAKCPSRVRRKGCA